jgi:hypothetical protein
VFSGLSYESLAGSKDPLLTHAKGYSSTDATEETDLLNVKEEPEDGSEDKLEMLQSRYLSRLRSYQSG